MRYEIAYLPVLWDRKNARVFTFVFGCVAGDGREREQVTFRLCERAGATFARLLRFIAGP